MITGMDRLKAAAVGRRADRIPVFCNLLEQGAGELGISSIQEYYSKGEYVAEAQLRMQRKYGYDNVWNLFYVGKEAELLGCNKIIYAENGPPNVGELILQNYEDIHKLTVPADITTHPKFAECVKCMNILVREVGGKQPIAAYLTSSMTLPAILMGMDLWFDLLLTGPHDVRDELLSKCSEFFRKHMAYQLAAGADCLVYANPFASTATLPIKMIDELVFPWMARDLEGFDRSKIIFYCGGSPFNNVIERVIQLLGISNFYLSPMANIDEGRRIVNGRGLICGVMDDIKLLHWSKEQIRAEVRRILTEGMLGNRFAFGVQGMPADIPTENIRCMLEAVFEFGSAESSVRTES